MVDRRNASSREIDRDLNISHESFRSILVDILDMRSVASQLVLKELNSFQNSITFRHAGSRQF